MDLPFNSLKYYGFKKNILGEGGYGKVFKYMCNEKNICYAVKTFISTEYQDEYGIGTDILREISILTTLQHPNIVKLIDVTGLDTGNIAMIMELGYKSLRMYIIENNEPIDSKLIMSYIYQISLGLQYIHSYDVWHRDIKPDNILIYTDGRIRITDFGISKFGSSIIFRNTIPIQTLYYRAPEILLGSQFYGPKVDIFSLGVIFGELILKSSLFNGSSEGAVLKSHVKLLGGMNEYSWPGISGMTNYRAISDIADYYLISDFNHVFQNHKKRIGDDGIELLQQMLIPNPNNRIGIMEILKSTYFDDIRNYLPPVTELNKNDILDTISPYPITIKLNNKDIYLLMNTIFTTFMFCDETRFHSRGLLDLYINNTQNIIYPLDLIAITTIFISSKIFEKHPPSIKSFIDGQKMITSIKDFIKCERHIIGTMKFKLMFPIMTQYIQYYTTSLSIKTKNNVRLLCLLVNSSIEISDPKKMVSDIVYLSVLCSNDRLPDCISISETPYNLMKNIITTYKQNPRDWSGLKGFITSWDICKDKFVSGENLPQSREISITSSIKNLKNINQSSSIIINKNIHVIHASDGNISRDDLADIIKYLLSWVAANILNNIKIATEESKQAFSKYFGVIKTINNNYGVPPKPIVSNSIQIHLGALTVDTQVSIKFDNIPDKTGFLFNKIDEKLKFTEISVDSLILNIT
jgi:serine/threonine protein kinase